MEGEDHCKFLTINNAREKEYRVEGLGRDGLTAILPSSL
jgi:hypothetical protein